MNFGPHYLVLFLRNAPPPIELCDPALSTLLDQAIAITDRYGARWGPVRESLCVAAPTPGEVRVQVSSLPDGKLGRTHTDEDAEGYATTSVITLLAGDNVKVLAHELSHAQGIADVCSLGAENVPGPNCAFAASLQQAQDARPTGAAMVAPHSTNVSMVGHLMHPDSGSMGLDVVGMRWAVRQIYGGPAVKAPTVEPALLTSI